MYLKLFFLILISLFVQACQIAPVPDNQNAASQKDLQKQCGYSRGSFIGSWFDYYERGLSYADCQMWPESERDLRTAISRRSEDRRRVYSLGMHLINNYFPNRELGVALFYQQKYDEAETYLQTSLSQFPTTKAEEFLKRVRKIKLTKSDSEPPVITLTAPVNNFISNQSFVDIQGMVEDDSYIESVTINGIPQRYIPPFKSKSGIPVRVARYTPKLKLDTRVPINFINGRAKLAITAKDISGKVSHKTVWVEEDKQGPQLNVKSIKAKANDQYHIVVNVEDTQSAIKQIQLNNKIYEVKSKTSNINDTDKKLTQISIDEVISGPFDDNNLIIIAVDNANNQTKAQLSLNDLSAEKNNLANYAFIDINFTKGGENKETLETKAYIEGEIISSSPIREFVINGKNLLSSTSTQLYFNYSPELKSGQNTFTVTIRNKQGKTSRKSFIIQRKIPPSHSFEERLKIAQFPFTCNVISRTPCFVSENTFEHLYKKLDERKRFQITDKTHIITLIDTINACEKGISEKCTVKVAEQLINQGYWDESFANAIFAGDIIERKNDQGDVSIEISGNMVDYKTKEILTSVDIYAEKMAKENFESFSQNLITEIADAFPLVVANITNINEEALILNKGERDRLWEQMPLLVYQIDNQLNCGSARLQEVSESSTQAELDDSNCSDISPETHQVITR